MDELNSFLEDADIPEDMCTNARMYLRSTRELRKTHAYDKLLLKFSPGLRGEITLHLSKATFGQVSTRPYYTIPYTHLPFPTPHLTSPFLTPGRQQHS